MIKVIDNYLMPYEYDMIRAYFEGDMDNGTVDGSCNWNFVDGCAQLGDGHFHFNSLIHSMFEVRVPRAYELLKPLIERTNMSSIARIKANCMLKTHELMVFTNSVESVPATIDSESSIANTMTGASSSKLIWLSKGPMIRKDIMLTTKNLAEASSQLTVLDQGLSFLYNKAA